MQVLLCVYSQCILITGLPSAALVYLKLQHFPEITFNSLDSLDGNLLLSIKLAIWVYK